MIKIFLICLLMNKKNIEEKEEEENTKKINLTEWKKKK